MFSNNNKNDLLSIFQTNNVIKSYSFEYLNQQNKKHWTSGEVIVILKNELNIDSILIQQNIDFIQIKRNSIFTNYFTILLTNNSDPFLISNQLYSTTLFEIVSPNFFYEINFSDYNDNPHFLNQYYLNDYDVGFNNGINAKNAWEISTGTPNLKIAVLDGGVILNHEDLVDNLIHGHDATVEQYINPDLHGGPSFGDEHGTEVAGVIVASNNNIGIVGIAHTSKVFPIRIGKPIIDNDMGSWYTKDSWIIAGLEAAISNDCSVINCSFHHDESIAINNAIDSVSIARNGKGIPIVCASGNAPNGENGDSENLPYLGHSVNYPAIHEYTIAVGGIKQSSQFELDFNFGKGLDLIAPATEIRTSSHNWTSNVNNYIDKDGTSFSAPMVTATIALMLSVNSNLTNTQIKEILFTTTSKIPCAYSGDYNTTEQRQYGTWTWTTGYGLLNTHAAVFESAFYGIPMIISGPSEIELCNETIISISEFDIPEWVDSINWIMGYNVLLIEQISPFSIKVKAVGVGNAGVSFNIVHRDYTKTIKKCFIVTSSENNIYNSYEFEGVQSISSNALISGKNIVKTNSTLTISAQVQCTPNASIIVEPGGKLIINNGVLNNYCADFPWQGIVVEGNSNSSQVGFSPNQGSLTMNNGTISNAKFGIMVGDVLTNTKSGGIITLTNSYFYNNRISIYMAPYKNMFNNGELRNRSTITNCNFIVNNDFYVEQTNFFCHVYLNDINGLIFNGCTFISTMTIPQNSPTFISFPKTGIRSFNSGFTVRPTCSTSFYLGGVCPNENITSNSTFSGLDYGIVASSSGNLKKIEINSTHFLKNDYGIYINGVNNPKIVKNEFSVGKDNLNITSRPVGIYLQNSTGFRIEDNEFTNNSESNLDKIGLIIKNSGKDNNQVYKNSFFELTIGQIFDGLNYSALYPFEGLVSLCNVNSDNKDHDFWVRKIDGYNYNGINQFQGGVINAEIVAAGNKFPSTSSVDYQYNNEANFLYYLYNPNNPDEELTSYSTSNTILPVPGSENYCPSKINGLNIQTIQSELTNINFNYGNLKYNYNQLIDAGNTPELIRLIQDVWSEDIWKLRAELLGKSPYLSQEAIISVAQENLLPPALLLEICIANPDATRDQGFLDILRYGIPTPLPEYMINLIIASWDVKTLRTEMEEQLSAFKTYRDEYQTYKTEILFSDTIYNYTDIINHLETRGSYSDYLSMAEIAINQDDYAQANLYLDILENNNGKLSEEESAEVESYRDYITIRESIFLDTTSIYNLDSTQIASLETYASSNNYRGAILARNILCFLYDICIDDVSAPPKMLRVGSNSNSGKNTTPYIASVKVLPNPANSYVSFIWDMKSYDQPAILYIYDQTGKIVMTKKIENTQGQWIWDLKNTPSGVYVYTLKSDQLILFSGKVNVNK